MASHGSIVLANGSSAQAISAAVVKLTAFSDNGPHSSEEQGDQAIAPDAANDRIDLKPGTYPEWRTVFLFGR
jgi:hypothetical protein